MKIAFLWHSYKYLPYERMLAKRELAMLFNATPVPNPDGFLVEAGEQSWQGLASRVTYFREAIAENGERVIPRQALLEASSNGNGQARAACPGIAPLLRRQSTRYGAHGIHEYRGKFNPQVVRSIGNLLGLTPGAWVLDPFCGSGTLLLEAAYNGWNAVGLDINPLGIEIAKAKLAALHVSPEELAVVSAGLAQRVSDLVVDLQLDSPFEVHQETQVGGAGWEHILPNPDYLQAWFARSVLVQLAAIVRAIADVRDPEMRAILRVVLSDTLRDVSLQEPSDLRIRRRKAPLPNMPAIPMFVDKLISWTRTAVRVPPGRQSEPHTVQQAVLGDVRQAVEAIGGRQPSQLFDAAITSPPYVTALPYIDTQRLSLTLLGLIDSREIRATEQLLIGNREIANRARQVWERALQENRLDLPGACWDFCCELAAAVDSKKDGFRRQNTPALTYQYFCDMGVMFDQVRQMLRPSARFVLVVGSNTTTLGGHRFEIDTPRWLGILAEKHGFKQQEVLEMDTYPRYDVHLANSIRTETMLILEALPDAG